MSGADDFIESLDANMSPKEALVALVGENSIITLDHLGGEGEEQEIRPTVIRIENLDSRMFILIRDKEILRNFVRECNEQL